MIVEVFTTNVMESSQAESLLHVLRNHYPGSKINFDLDDCDKILRIEGDGVVVNAVISIVQRHGFDCSVLN